MLKRIRLTAGVLAATFLTGCGAWADHALQATAYREATAKAVADTTWLQSPERQKAGGQVFIGAEVLSSVLAGLDGTALALDDAPGVELVLKQARLSFDLGVPLASIELTAQHPESGATAEVRLAALVLAEPAGERLQLRFQVLEAKPVLSFQGLSTGSWSLINQLGLVAATSYAKSLPAIVLPVGHTFTFSTQTDVAVSLPIPGSPATIMGQVQSAGFDGAVALKVLRVIGLNNGLHVYLGTEG